MKEVAIQRRAEVDGSDTGLRARSAPETKKRDLGAAPLQHCDAPWHIRMPDVMYKIADPHEAKLFGFPNTSDESFKYAIPFSMSRGVSSVRALTLMSFNSYSSNLTVEKLNGS
jgi:hypothetical protein